MILRALRKLGNGRSRRKPWLARRKRGIPFAGFPFPSRYAICPTSLIKSPRGNNKSVEYRLDMTAIAKRRFEVEEGKKKQRAENSAKRKAQWDAKHSA